MDKISGRPGVRVDDELVLDAGSCDETDHERDTALGALGAWAMVHQAAGWKDIRGLDANAISPLAAPLAYWVPTRTM